MDQLNYSEDIELWRRLQEGDEEAVSELFNKYYKALLNYGLKLVSDEAHIKDSIQELFYTIWNQRDNLSDVKYVRAYLYISLRRTVYRQVEIKQTRSNRDKEYSKDHFREIVNQEKLMIREELKKEQSNNLKSALKSLNAKQKEAIFLKFYSGLSYVEIAQVMDVNKQSAYNYIYRAIQSLRSFLDE